METKTQKIEISHKTIIFTFFFILFMLFLYSILDVILQFFVSLIIMASFNPIVTRMGKYKIPRGVAVIFVYLIFFLILGIAIYALIPAIIEQTTSFVNNLPVYLDNLGIPIVVREKVLSEFLVQIGGLPGQIARTTISIFSNVLGVITVLIFAFYLLIYRNKFDDILSNFLIDEKKSNVHRIIDRLENQLGGWARGELLLMFLVGVLSYTGLLLLGIPFALPLAILSGMFEIIPVMGPTVSAIPAIIIGFGISPITGVATASLAFLIQQIENYVFVPKVMQRSVGVNPIVTLLALAIGFKLSGIVGVLISVPVVIAVQVLLKEYVTSKN